MLNRLILTLVPIAAAALIGTWSSQPESSAPVVAGASKKAVRASLGAPTVARGLVRSNAGELVEVWEYWDDAADKGGCWYYFIDNELVATRAAGDWAEEPRRIAATSFDATAERAEVEV